MVITLHRCCPKVVRDEVAALNGSDHGKYNALSRILPKDMIPERIGTDLRAGYSCHIDKGT